MRTVLFTGSRGWRDVRMALDAVDGIRQPFRGIVGDADGFDAIIWQILTKRNLPRWKFKAKWRIDGHYNPMAGHERNYLMLIWLTTIDPDGFVIAGWDGKSTGTKGCMDAAKQLDVPVWPIMYVPTLNERGDDGREQSKHSRSRHRVPSGSR